MKSPEERIAVLEEQHVVTKETLEDIEITLTDTNSNLVEINTKLAKQQSFWAGVTFLATILGVVIRSAWDWLQNHIQ